MWSHSGYTNYIIISAKQNFAEFKSKMYLSFQIYLYLMLMLLKLVPCLMLSSQLAQDHVFTWAFLIS